MNANNGQQKIGEQRFRSGIEYEKQLLRLTRAIQDQLLSALPSNYSRDRNTNLAEFFRSVAKEFARLQISSSETNDDKYHDDTRTEYLWQILGDTLFLGEKAINESLSDVQYRDFLIRVRNAYYGGSRPDNIESAVSDIVGLPVTLRELYLEARTAGSSYGLKDTHTMFFDILMDGVDSSSTIGLILQDLKFFIDILKPAHVKYDTRLIWTDEARIRDGECTPVYDMQSSLGAHMGGDRFYMVTWLATSVYLYSGTDPSEIWESGVISSIDTTAKVITMVDNRLVSYTSDTDFYRRTGSTDEAIDPDILVPGDEVKYYATKDWIGSSDVIDSEWGLTGIISSVDEASEVVWLDSGVSVSYGDGVLIWTRDGAGEYRINMSDLSAGREVAFKGIDYEHTKFKFYQTPQQVTDNYYKQFDQEVIDRPFFQENVYKVPDYPPGMTGGPNIVMVDGVATVVEVDPKFYAREGDTRYRERVVDRYSLSVDGDYTAQFSVNDPDATLTKAQAKTIFSDVYGYTGINAPGAVWDVQTAHTGDLVEDGADARILAVEDETWMCERKAACQLAPYYEDMRKYWAWPDLQLTSGFFLIVQDFPDVPDTPDTHDVPAWFQVSSDPDVYRMPLLPMLGPEGEPATAADVTVYVSGLRVDDAVAYIDPWSGIVGLNFIPPFHTTLRVDYWHTARYPVPQTHLVESVLGATPLPGDLAAQMTVISTTGIVTRLLWPFPVTDPDLYGDERDYQVNKFPILNQRGELATTDDITVSVGETIANGTTTVSGYTGTDTILDSGGDDWSTVQEGDTIVLEAENYLDRTLIYRVQSVDAVAGNLVVPGLIPPLIPSLSSSYPYWIFRFLEVEDAVTDVRPLLGHIRVNFLAPTGVVVKFEYHYTPERREYLMVPDFVGETGADFYGASQYTMDTYYGPRNGYSMVVDYAFTGPEIPHWPFEDLLQYGYRYRAFDLTGSAVLNSETLLLNSYTTPSQRGSFKGAGGNLNQSNVVFSSEYLTDTDKNVILNDRYLQKDLDPATKLYPKTPLFIQSQTDDGHYTLFSVADEHPSYDSALEGGKDLQASFSIIDPDNAGIIDRNMVCDIEENGRVTLYSDLKVVRTDNGGYDAPLSTINDTAAGTFKAAMVERYYPNREQRVNDYLDYINQVPSEFKTGSLTFMRDSNIIKSRVQNVRGVRRGDVILVKDVPFSRWNIVTDQWDTVAEDLEYIVVEIVDTQTARINSPFEGPKGDYDYELTRHIVYNADVRLNEVNRLLVLNNDAGFNYGVPESILMHLTGYGVTGVGYEVNFADPDPDPYPRSPDNPNIRHPEVSYYTIGDVVVDGVVSRTNRTLGITGLVLTSDIIDADGNSYGYTGYASGVTGPSGALNLGLTGPVEYANPRTVEAYDVYTVPGGDTGAFFSYSEAEYRVQWRNWDQELFLVTFNMGETGVIVEDPINLLDDVADNIKRFYWNVDQGVMESLFFRGTLIESSEEVTASVAATSFPLGLVVLTTEEVEALRDGTNPATMGLTDANYQMNLRVVRELLPNNYVKVTEIQEFVRL